MGQSMGRGNFVRGPRVDGEDEDGEEDGWLDGNQDKLVVDDATREKIETRKEEDVEKVAGPGRARRGGSIGYIKCWRAMRRWPGH